MGAKYNWSEADDLNSTALDGGGAFNVSVLPMQKTSWGTCEVLYPHNFLRVNTVFEVGRGNGLVTAYADNILRLGSSMALRGLVCLKGIFRKLPAWTGVFKRKKLGMTCIVCARSPVLTDRVDQYCRVGPAQLD